MTTIGLVAVAIALIGAVALLATFTAVSAIGSAPEEAVGGWRAEREEDKPPTLPRDFESLVWGEAVGWHQPRQWDVILDSLNRLELDFGGLPPPGQPEKYDAAWLDWRLKRIEALAGPMPGPLPPAGPTVNPPFWKQWFS